jgi:integrase/recombinase XerD
MEALLAAPDQSTWSGRRDYALLLVTMQTGLRVSELIGLRCEDVALDAGPHVHCRGKGRKERCTPLRKEAAAVLRSWLRERKAEAEAPLFPNARWSRGPTIIGTKTYASGRGNFKSCADLRMIPACLLIF